MPASLRTCKNGHLYYKSSDCPTCPVCEEERKPTAGFLSSLAAPARRALENEGILTIQQLAERSESEILQLHGMGKSSLPKLHSALKEHGLRFQTDPRSKK
ncbi:RNA polymerase alpha subunit C-terminal domain-containing protein [uncultured Sunxiuqinia sp.]|uniref:RNA polymerase alpha subunit C-terminal domain-containing protein n=1 Tax=uncultured Sunxiuqinia sp. TaxID=1573825 RepID=UPI0030DA34FD|tara:strand:- start:51111 stop:51413 length:303 start_codon:yes stop_codon:yes gene_type:complete